MSKKKIIIIVSAVIVALALILLGIKFAGKSATDGTTDPEATNAVQTPTNEKDKITGEPYTTVKPFIDSQIEVFPPTTATDDNVTGDKDYTTTKPFADSPDQPSASKPSTDLKPTVEHEEHATQIDKVEGWKDNELTINLPKINKTGITTSNFISEKGYRTVIRLKNFDYNSYLTYIDRLEAAGFKDNNNRAHIPSTAPLTVAMFYHKFDGERSFGVYWYGDESAAGFDCEIVISDYDQAK